MYTKEQIEQRVKNGESCAKFDLRGINFDGANLAYGRFCYTNFSGCSMRSANFSFADTRDANFSGVDTRPLPSESEDAAG